MSATTNPTVVFEPSGRVVVDEQPLPTLSGGDVLIRTTVSLISAGTELALLDEGVKGQVWKSMRERARGVGYSNVGTVVETGTGVDRSWVGKRVVSASPHAAFVAASTDALLPLPGEVPTEAAALAPLTLVALHGIHRSKLVAGESVAIVGTGLLGHLTARLAAIAGARAVVAINRSAPRLRWLPRESVFHGLSGAIDELREAAFAANRGERFDLVVEASGDPAAIAGALSLVRPQGRMLLLGSPRGPSTLDFHDLCQFPSVTILGCHFSSCPREATPGDPWSVARCVELFLDHVSSGRLALADLVSHSFPFREAARAYELLASRREPAMGVLLRWSDG